MFFVLTVGVYTPVRAISQTALMPAATINIAHFYKPPQGMDASTAVNNFNTIVLTNGDHNFRGQLEGRGFSSSIPQYFRTEGIQDPGSCTASPSNNQVGYKAGDFCFISQNHPDWFLLDQYGRRITTSPTSNYYRMDPGNAGWRDFFLARVVESQNQYGWSALFLDNVEGSLGKFYGDSRPAKYLDDFSYQSAIMGFLQYLDVNYSQKYNRPIMGNITTRGDDAVWFNYLQYLDGAMQERFAVDWSVGQYVSEKKWNSDLVQVEKTQANGKYVILIAPGSKADTNRQKFAFASYLLVSNGKAAFRYSTDDAYDQVWLYDNYNVDLGDPLGPRYQSGGSSWRRDFTKGYVVADPVSHTAVISTAIPSTFADVPTYHWASEYVERLYSAGITSGCGGENYCPEIPVTRAQMAVFLLRSIHGSSYNPPSVGGSTGFGDVPTGHWAAGWIKQLAAENVTSGCGGGNYCPEIPVTRAQMSVFLLRSIHGPSYNPPPVGGSTGFGDVPTAHWAAGWIKQLAAESVTSGCGGGNYCPETTVTRAQMSVFLVRAFSLP